MCSAAVNGFARTATRGQLAFVKAFAWAVLAVQVLMLAVAFQAAAVSSACAQAIPREAIRHQRTLVREARQAWGLDAPVASFAAQIHQESRWRADARSPAGAHGLTQFMPATARWLPSVAPSVGPADSGNPTWAIRALVAYDQWLWRKLKADDDCEHMAFVLSSYNGGLGWVYKRQAHSVTPGICMGATCTLNPGVSAASQRENEHYPRVILIQYEPLYASWGRGSCS